MRGTLIVGLVTAVAPIAATAQVLAERTQRFRRMPSSSLFHRMPLGTPTST